MAARADEVAKNPMISGNWEPVKEEIESKCLDIEGSIPKDLAGSFFRNGPNAQFDPVDYANYHFFDGDGMIHQIEFVEGEARYKNKWVETECLQMEREQGNSLWKGFNAPPDFEHPSGIAMKHPANTHVIYHNKTLMALWEAGLPYAMDLPEMNTIGKMDFNGEWPHAFTAHPTIDPRNGDLVTFYYSILAKPHVKYGVINKDGKVVHETGIDLPKPVMIHDLAISKNYSIISDLPYVFSIDRAMAGEYPFAWEPDNGARIGVIPRYGDGSEIKWFEVELGYILHVFNAYEEGDEVVFEACRSKHTSVVTDDDYDPKGEQGQPYQYRFNMKTGEHTEALIEDVHVEFSRINDDYTGVKNRYGYACRFVNQKTPRFDALVKFDREENRSETFEFEAGSSAGEFVFAPRLNAKSEDDGYCLGLVNNQKAGTSKMLIFDAQKIAQGPVATIDMPARVPNGFHANWVPLKDYQS